MATTTPRMKITYATLSADNEELQSAFDAAVERVRGELGRSYPMLIGAEERSGAEEFEDRSPIDSEHHRLPLPGRHPRRTSGTRSPQRAPPSPAGATSAGASDWR